MTQRSPAPHGDGARDVTPDEVEALFDAWLARSEREGPESADFDAFCAEHPRAEAQLRRLRAAFDRFGGEVDVIDDELERSTSGGDAARGAGPRRADDGSSDTPTKMLLAALGDETSQPDAGDGHPTVELDLEGAGTAPDSREGATVARSFAHVVERLGRARPAYRRYTNGREVARGGMGAILKAWDSDLRRYLAMKIMLPARGDASDAGAEERRLARFLEEAQITGQLDHPGIVPVHEIGRDAQGRLFFTMRFVRGRSFGEIVDLVHAGGKDGWTLPRALDVLLKVCDTLAYAHSKDVVHRDIKPANVMVGRFGEVYVMDWGLAKVMGRTQAAPVAQTDTGQTDGTLVQVQSDRRDHGSDPASPLRTVEGAVVGTPAYMSPEQALGRSESVGPATDVYAVGALMYFLLSGQAPYMRRGQRLGSKSVLEAVRAGPPRPVTSLKRRLPADLVSICNKAMRREIRERYPTMRAMADDLRAFVEGRVVRASRTGALAELRKWIVRNKGGATVALVSFVVLLGALFFLLDLNDKLSREKIVARDAAVEASASELRARASAEAALHGERLAKERESEAVAAREREARATYAANIEAADGRLRYAEVTEAERRLAACPEELRRFEWAYLRLVADGSLATVAAHDGRISDAAFARLGSDFVTGSLDGSAVVWNKNTRTEVTRVDHGRPVTAVSYDPGSPVAALGDDQGEIVLFDAFEGTLLQHLRSTRRTGAVTALLFGPQGGGLLLAGYAGGSVAAWNLATQREIPFVGHTRQVTDLSLSALGDTFVSGSTDGAIHVWDASARDTGPLFSYYDARGAVEAVAMSPTGDQIAAGTERGKLHVFSISGELPPIEVDTDGAVAALAFTTDGASVLCAGAGRSVQRFDAFTGELQTRLLGHRAPVTCVAVDPDGALFVTGAEDGQLRVWDASSLSGATAFGGDMGAPRSLALSPDGRRALTSSDDGRVVLWDARARLPLDLLDLEPPAFHEVAWSPTGGSVALGPSVPSSDGRCAIRVLDVVGDGLVDRGTRLDRHRRGVDALVFSPDGARLLSGGKDGRLLLWDALDGTLLREFEGHDILLYAAAFSPDGARLASGGDDGTLRLWDADTGTGHVVGDAGDAVTQLAWSPDGRRLAVVRDRAPRDAIELLDVADERVTATLTGHAGDVLALAWHPSAERLASAGRDGTIVLWDGASAQRVLTLRPGEPVTSLAFDAAGERLFSCLESTVMVYETARPEELAAVRSMASAVAEQGRRVFEQRLAADVDPRVVIARLADDTELEPAVRAEALRRARLFGQDPERLANAAWPVVLEPFASRAVRVEALARARAADALHPGDPRLLAVLGGAWLRSGDTRRALTVLGRAQKLDPDGDRFPLAVVLSLTALSHAAAGDTAAASLDLSRAEREIGLFGMSDAEQLVREARRKLDAR
ncbi:MAG: protein kinase [Planctomycetes bacterium]|nr:protein kinase [Planctomycetota bacterium]